ncbi:amidohydrolase [Azospirillum sp. RWY-5-1]|uniref:Amidohydrolase n=1 Tax=Azospirillum oleiclasticum TaxID=2735135 RepID=A0ABX2T814_9PROT|nr:M20 aminoacylase family protein [Azospirillum oleiclasticum]NYZ13313.1 amidohydrolase [Azospirillum oleiclasticum]NYZ20474.1 amidohydrolase [Azospirillum oleiclasticum]
MPVVNRIADFHADMTAWRRDLHAHPELAYEEHRTADMVASKLAEFGIGVRRGLGGTGVVGTLRGSGGGGRAIGLRADMDALPIQEANDVPHVSRNPGRMHACGHDGHTTMLLGAARYLAETRNFDGTVHFIFQPAEEGRAGARAMMADGLFREFPVEAVYGLHNWPELEPGTMTVHDGPVMAAADQIEITVTGQGAHAAMPHLGVDPIAVAAQIVTAAQTLVSRSTDPLDAAVLSITTINAGSTFNVIPAEARLTGTVRSFRPETQDRLEAQLRRLVTGIAAAMGATADLVYRRGYPVTRNSAAETEVAAGVAARLVGAERLRRDLPPSMGAEDFGFMLAEIPGCYAWIGQGGSALGCTLHNPRYDFNDDILPLGASYWATLVETTLPRSP